MAKRLPPRLGGFMPRVSADIRQLAQRMREQLLTREDMPKLRGIPWRSNTFEPGDDTASVFDMLSTMLTDLPDEGYKLFPWVVREVKKGYSDIGIHPERREVGLQPTDGINAQNKRHAMDIITQAIRWFVWSYEHNKPLPDYMSKQFGFTQLEQWVYEMHAQGNENDGSGWQDSTPVYTFPDGWHIDYVGSDDLAQEGELMGHCVGGYCNTVSSGHSTIFSLRDPKGTPHVTIEMGGSVGDDVTKGFGEVDHQDRILRVIQEQGKSNAKPIPEYQRRVDDWYDHLRTDGGWDVEYSQDEEPEMIERYEDTDTYPTTHEGIGDFYNDLTRDSWKFHDDEDPEVEYERGRCTLYYRVPNYIGDHSDMWTNPEDGAQYPRTARVEQLHPALAQTLQRLWSGKVPDDEAQEWAQAYIAAAHHTLQQYGTDDITKGLNDLVEFASNWVAKKRLEKPARQPGQPSLFEPDEYFEQAQMPRPVQTFMHYLVGYHFAGGQPAENTHKWNPMQHPVMPGSGSWPVAEFPEYFGGLEQQSPQFFNTDWLQMPSNAVAAHLIAKLRRMAGYTTDWNFEPGADRFEYPQCPYDKSELEIALHGGATCPTCKNEFEVGREDTILPSDRTVDDRASEWPDTMPWGEKEQAYYRTAADDWKIPRNSEEWFAKRRPWMSFEDGHIWIGQPGEHHDAEPDYPEIQADMGEITPEGEAYSYDLPSNQIRPRQVAVENALRDSLRSASVSAQEALRVADADSWHPALSSNG